MKRIFLLSFLFILSGQLCAQVKQGTIEYQGFVNWAIAPNGDTVFFSNRELRNDITAFVYFTEEFNRFEMMATIAYSMTSIHDKNQGHVLDWVNDFGDRYAFTWILEDYEDMEVNYIYNSPEDSFRVELNQDTTKTILGYTCAYARTSEYGDVEEYWYTEKVDPGDVFYPVGVDLPGVCLEFTVNLETASFVFVASSINVDPPDPKYFEMRLPYGFALEYEPDFPIILPEKKEPVQSNEIPPPPPLPREDEN